MSILLGLMLAQAQPLPEIDRRSLDRQARAEAAQSRRPSVPVVTPRRAVATTSATTAVRNTTAQRRPIQQVAAQTRHTVRPASVQSPIQAQTQFQRPATIRRASGEALDLNAITTICRAAGNQADPATFLATLTRAYSLDSGESQSLRTSCAAYLAGRADARTSDHGAPAH